MALIEGDGTPESAWQDWLGTAFAPPTGSGWLTERQRLVVLAPHPDDEVLACGGLIAMHVARGGECLVVVLTDGEACDARLDAGAMRSLGEQRRAESEAGLACLGLEAPTAKRLGLPDGGLAGCAAEAERALLDLLRSDDVLLTTWRHDGHPDHEAAGRCAARVAVDTGATLVEAPVWMWHWASPGDLRVPWHRLSSLALTEIACRNKLAALARHESQLAPRSHGQEPVLNQHTRARASRRYEHYFV